MATTIRVACKLPNGLKVDHTDENGKVHEFTLKGANDPNAITGFGVTDVDADLFKDWMAKTGQDFPPVQHDLIFALPEKDGEGKVKERAKDKRVRSGAEPIDPTKPARGIEPTEQQQRELDKLPEEPGGQTVNAK